MNIDPFNMTEAELDDYIEAQIAEYCKSDSLKHTSLSELPVIQEKLTSEQYPYSELLIDLRIEHGLDIYDMTSRTLLLDVETYLEMEYADTNIPIKDYKQAIRYFYKSTAFIRSNEGKVKPKGILLSDHLKIDNISFKDLDSFQHV